MSTTLPPIAKGVQARTNPLPSSDDEQVEIKKYASILLREMELNYAHMFLGRPSNFTDDAAERHTLKAIRISAAAAVVDVTAVEAVLGYTFQDKALLESALTHPSFRARRLSANGVPTFKDLELLGDKVISHVVTRRHLLPLSKSAVSDSLTRLHSLNGDNEKLARAAVAHGLHRFLRHEVPSFERHVDDFTEEIVGYPLHSNGQVWTPKLLSDIVESLIAAVSIDSSDDQEQVWQKTLVQVFQRVADPLIGPETMATIGEQPMTEFTELKHRMKVKAKIDTREWAKSRTVKVVLAGETIGSATYGRSKDVAKNRAVKAALDMINKKIAGQHQSAKLPSQVWRKK